MNYLDESYSSGNGALFNASSQWAHWLFSYGAVSEITIQYGVNMGLSPNLDEPEVTNFEPLVRELLDPTINGGHTVKEIYPLEDGFVFLRSDGKVVPYLEESRTRFESS